MPLAVLSRGQYKGFRTGRFADSRGNVVATVRFDEVWKFDSDVRPLFEVPCCVLFGERVAIPTLQPSHVIGFHGDLPRRDATAAEARKSLTSGTEAWPDSADAIRISPYRANFKQGATIVPRRFAFVTHSNGGRFGVDPNSPVVESRITSQDKIPWKNLPALRGKIERRFLRPILLGESIVPFRVREAATAIIPWNSQTKKLLDAAEALDDGYHHLAGWLKQAEMLWNKHSAGGMTLIDRWNYHNGTSGQFPIAPIRVVFAASGTLPCATVVLDRRAIVEHKLYWAPATSIKEAYYLVSILGSEAARRRVEKLQSRGQWGARDFDKVMFTLPIPRFDVRTLTHRRLAELGEIAEKVAKEVNLIEGMHFQAARRVVRAALAEVGITQRIDKLVDELLG